MADEDAVQDKKKTKIKLWKKILLGAAVVIVAIIVIVMIATAAPVKISNEFLSDIQNKRAEQGYALLSKEAKGITSAEEFKKTVDRIGPLLNTKAKMTGRQVEDETGAPASAQVTYDIKATDGVEYKITVQLVKEDGRWLVRRFDSSKK